MDVDIFLEHHGVKGMHWGIRHPDNPDSKVNTNNNSKNKKRVLIIGSAIGAAAIIAGAIYIKKHYNVSMSEISKKTELGNSFTKDFLKEPNSVIHAARGKDVGFRFIKKGGINEPLNEFVKNNLDVEKGGDFIQRYGKNNEKIYAAFSDPNGRKDFAGRLIHHQIIVPKELSEGITSLDQLKAKIWPLIKDDFEKVYQIKRN